MCSNEFVNLDQLLQPNYEESYELHVSNTDGINGIDLRNRPKSTNLTIAQWDQALTGVMATYLQKNPAEVASMLQYAQLNKKLASKQGNWKPYAE